MEFGLFLQGYVPGPDAHDTDREHEAFMREVELVVAADRTNWKFAWFSEHHALTEYSHLSSSEVMMGYLARATSRIHLGSGIFNLSPRVNHPVRNAERVAMLDHLSEGRFEFGTGRGAGSHETATFNIGDTSSTKVEWDEVIREIPRMWETEEYTFQGNHFSVDKPHNILPKPYRGMHPPIWVACGNPATFGKAGSLGIGALGFNFSPIHEMRPMIEAYKKGIAECEDPVGRYVYDNVMLTNAVLCFEDGERARDIATRPNRGYLYSLVCLYHDTFPKPPGAPVWPEPPIQIKRDMVDPLIDAGLLLCGRPDEVAEQLKAYEETGVDQVVFGVPNDLSHEEALEVIETFGTKVIPEFDRDPVHSTDRYRDSARQA
jgi:alkanesulfonate monooxygenase SsuD/methylene tetrahydromethanopterin reductase-like flavin-dependent oxidoreductase (luciferase family)